MTQCLCAHVASGRASLRFRSRRQCAGSVISNYSDLQATVARRALLLVALEVV